ncbi:MAG: [Fe-Fe] hydrogenase large subunit C-terminal domain-containing protein [Oscillospiraceae bacterium]|nr:[Fe-Fe] hydrogenase large subunit C-terminal domain-containing protein [Oscillospiraceae bacterium]MDD4413593.1 [Fe-Fe] hydrogenase large subunit C-terminal domain-containing protein [Oscillospiraceae bacterium]
MDRFFHSVTLDKDLCVGCTNCIKRCPTQAIRVRGGKAQIISERCIDCGECVRVCPHHAKKARHDSLDMLENYEYNIALPAPTLYGQFNRLDDIDFVLNGLKALGFDDIFEVSRAAEIVSDATRQLLADGKLKMPVISSACPAVVRLIRVRFPDLCDHVLPLASPMEVAAGLAREAAIKKTGLSSDKIGIFFISPCAAKVTDVRVPIGIEKSNVDGVLSISDIYPRLVGYMNKLEQVEPIANTGIIGVGWSSIGGEAAGLLNENHLAADGIGNVIKVLEELEDEKLQELDFIELNACAGGCVGGIFTAENGYVARARIQRLRKYLPVSCNRLEDAGGLNRLQWTRPLEFAPVMTLADKVEDAMRLMGKIDEIAEGLPKLDCGSCGAPTCRALAEDIVWGVARDTDCIFLMRRQIQDIANQLSQLEGSVTSEHAAEPHLPK